MSIKINQFHEKIWFDECYYNCMQKKKKSILIYGYTLDLDENPWIAWIAELHSARLDVQRIPVTTKHGSATMISGGHAIYRRAGLSNASRLQRVFSCVCLDFARGPMAWSAVVSHASP